MKQVATCGHTGGGVKLSAPCGPVAGISRHQQSVTRQLNTPRPAASGGGGTGTKLSCRASHGPYRRTISGACTR